MSKASATECFVYITLPGEVSPVTAGRFVLTENARGDALGQFVYRGKYIEDPDQGRYANAKNILSQHARFLLDRAEAEKIVNDMKARVETTWYETLRASGVSEKDAEIIRGAFVYPGFSV